MTDPARWPCDALLRVPRRGNHVSKSPMDGARPLARGRVPVGFDMEPDGFRIDGLIVVGVRRGGACQALQLRVKVPASRVLLWASQSQEEHSACRSQAGPEIASNRFTTLPELLTLRRTRPAHVSLVQSRGQARDVAGDVVPRVAGFGRGSSHLVSLHAAVASRRAAGRPAGRSGRRLIASTRPLPSTPFRPSLAP